MDPFSIVQAIAFAYRASETICLFIQDTKVIDRSLASLQRQVDGLARVLEALNGALDRQSLEDKDNERIKLWNVVTQSIEACYPTIRDLDERLHGIGAQQSNGNILRQASKMLKLRLGQEDIDRLLATIQTHSINLQLALGIVQLNIAASAPETVAQELSQRFERLERMIITVDERLFLQNDPTCSLAAIENTVGAVKLDENTKSLRQSAETIISSACTMTGHSVSGMTQKTALESKIPVFEYFDPPDTDRSVAVEKSTTGSELGVPIASSQRHQIQNWILTSSSNLANIPEAAQDKNSTVSPSNDLTSVFSGLSMKSDNPIAEPGLEIFNESSDDDELDMQVIKSYFVRAEDKIHSKDFKSAEQLLRRGLDESQCLSMKNKDDMGLGDIKLQYAWCCFQCNKLDDSEGFYSALTREPVKDIQGATRVLHALDGLAKVNLRKRRFEAASSHCRQALHGRRRTKTIGKTHADYFASIRLMVLINWARNDKVQAEAYTGLLPKELQPVPEELDRTLATDFQISPDDVSSIDSPAGPTSPKSLRTSDHQRTPSRSSFKSSDTPSLARPSSHQSQHDLVDQIQIATHHLTPSTSRPVGTVPLKESPAAAIATTPRPESRARRPSENAESTDGTAQSRANNEKDGISPLITAVKTNNLDLARILCLGFGQKSKLDVNTRGPSNRTPLIIAAMQGNLAICQLLISNNASVDAQDEDGNSAMMFAAGNGWVEICELLLSYNADPTQVDYQGNTAFSNAARNFHHSICKLLMARGVNPDTRSNHVATRASDSQTDTILSKPAPEEKIPYTGIQKKISSMLTSNMPNGNEARTLQMSLPAVSEEDLHKAEAMLSAKGLIHNNGLNYPLEALFWAIDSSSYAVMTLLLRSFPIDLSKLHKVETKYDETALHRTARNGLHDLCLLLLYFRAPLNALNGENQTPLDVAASNGKREIVDLLLKHGAWKDGVGNASTPLMMAASRNFLDVCRLLLREGADPNKRNRNADNALTVAVDQGNIELYLLLIEAGADPNTIARDGSTMLIKAARKRQRAFCASILDQGGCNVNIPDAFGMTALHYAVILPDLSLCDRLLESQGALCDASDKHGTTPLMLAVRDNINVDATDLAIITTLLRHHNTNPNSADIVGRTPLMMAADRGLNKVVEMLLAKGARAILKDATGATALIYAAKRGFLEICKDLVMIGGAAVSARDKSGKTAVAWAASKEVKAFLKTRESQRETFARVVTVGKF